MNDHARGCEGREYTCTCGYDAESDEEIAKLRSEVSRLEHMLKHRDRQAEASRKYWVKASKEAIDGDFRALRNRVELSEAPPMEVVLSEASQ